MGDVEVWSPNVNLYKSSADVDPTGVEYWNKYFIWNYANRVVPGNLTQSYTIVGRLLMHRTNSNLFYEGSDTIRLTPLEILAAQLVLETE